MKPLLEIEHWFQSEIVRPHEGRSKPEIERVAHVAFGLARNPGIARRAPQSGRQRGGRDLPRKRVLAPAGAEEQDVHGADVARFASAPNPNFAQRAAQPLTRISPSKGVLES